MPFSVGDNVANLSIHAFVGSGDENVWRTLCETFDYANNLRPRLAATENDFGKAKARSARMIDAREADVFEMKVLNAIDGLPVPSQEYLYKPELVLRASTGRAPSDAQPMRVPSSAPTA